VTTNRSAWPADAALCALRERSQVAENESRAAASCV